MGQYILGVDLGTSSMKCACYDEQMQLAAITRAHYCSSGQSPAAEDWWTALLQCLKGLGETLPLRDICCVSFSGYNALVGVDRTLAPVSPVLLYHDNRPVQHRIERTGSGDSAEIFRKTGNRLLANCTMANSIAFLRTAYPEMKVSSWLYSNGFLAARLTGRCTIDAPRASLSLLFHPLSSELSWKEDLLHFFKIPAETLPEILEPSDCVGPLTAQAAALTGLSAGIPVLAGAMDSVSAALGSGVLEDGQLFDIGGSAGGIMALSAAPRPCESFYLVRSILPGRWCSIGPLDRSGSLFTWYVSHFLPGRSIDAYFAQMETLPPLSNHVLFLPYLGGARHPYWSPATEGHFVAMTPQCCLDDMSRAVMDGLACAYRRICEDLKALGLFPSEIICGGGDTKSHTWLQTKANFLQLPYRLNQVQEASARGCAVLAAVKMGMLPDYRSSSPNPEQAIWIHPETAQWEKYRKYYLRFTQYCDKLYPEVESKTERC